MTKVSTQQEVNHWTELLTKSNETDIQASGILFDALSSYPLKFTQDTGKKYRQAQIKNLIKSIDIITTLGWEEHTADWDPYIVIELYDGTIIESESGYYIMAIQRDDLLLEDEPENPERTDDDTYHIIPLMNIKQITLNR